MDLYWLPLGAGGHCVRLNGRAFEAVTSRIAGRAARDLYHSALIVNAPHGSYVIEMTPVSDKHGELRGVVAEGAVGSRWAGGLRIFRYEIHRWKGGIIPDIDEAVESPKILSTEHAAAQRVLDIAPQVPTPVWGRNELDAGEMWNSNSVTSWLLARAGLDIESIRPPANGRAPGWDAGLAIALRQAQRAV